MKNIKVLHTEWSDGWGGQEIRIINEIVALREQGIEVCLACRENAKIKQKAIENSIEVFILPFNGNTDFKTLFGLIKIIKKYKVNILNTHSGKDTWVGGIAAKISGIRFIRTRHLSNKINSSRFNFINELADFILTTGESVKDDMIKNNRIKSEKIKSVPTGIDEEIFNPSLYDKNKFRELFGFKEDEIIIGTVAVLRGFKRHDLFVQAAKEVLKNIEDKKIKFVIAGDGPQKENIVNLIGKLDLKDNVVLLGHIDNVPQLLSAIDIFVLSSDSNEGVPQSVMQALLMNKPVIATDVGSTRDLYIENNFKLIEGGDSSVISSNILELINNKSQLVELSKISRNSIINKFSRKSMVENILKIYNKLI